MGLISKAGFEPPALACVTLEVPEWNGSILLKEISRHELKDIRKRATKVVAAQHMEAKPSEEIDSDLLEMLLFLACVVLDGDERFTEADWVRLNQGISAPIERILKEVLKMLGLSQEAQKKQEEAFLPE